jgi:hypothetical protein
MTVNYSSAQENFQPGYIINLDNDTLPGLIDIYSPASKLNNIRFIHQQSGEEMSFSPVDIVGFKTAADAYVSAIVQIEKPAEAPGMLSDNPYIQLKIDTVFLKTLISGEKSLYSCKNESGQECFYIYYESGYELLLYKRYLTKVGENMVIGENKTYINLLLVYLHDCPVIQRQMNAAAYNLQSLQKLFTDYYECKAGNTDFRRNGPKNPKQHGFLFGSSICHLKFTESVDNDDYADLVNTNFGYSVNFPFGYYYNIHLKDKLNKWSVNNDFMINRVHVEKEFTEYESDNDFTITTQDMAFTYFKLYNTMAYNFEYPKYKVFVDAGISNGLTYFYNNDKIIENHFYSMERTRKTTAIPRIRNHELGMVLGGGVWYKKVGLQLRIEKGNGMSGIEGLKASTMRYQLIFGVIM